MMANQENLILRLEPNSFGILRISLFKNNKTLSLNSTEIPSDLRHLARYSMSQEKLIDLLVDYLNECPRQLFR